MTLTPQALKDWTFQLLKASGLDDTDSWTAAEVFVRASLRKLGHHDISYLPQRLQWLNQGLVNSKAKPKLIHQTPAAEVWDAGGSLGEVACSHILKRSQVLAETQGLGYAVIRNSNHFLAAEPYVDQGAEAGFFTFLWSNTDAGMGVPGGTSRKIGNNPLGYAFPTGQEHPISADLCLAYSSLGNLVKLKTEQAQVPEHWGLSKEGAKTSQPQELWDGAVHPIGEHKGFALAILAELMTGVLASGPSLNQIAPGGGINTHSQMVLSWNLEKLGGLQAAQERAWDFAARTKKLDSEARVPGQNTAKNISESKTQGIQLQDSTYVELKEWSQKLRVTDY